MGPAYELRVRVDVGFGPVDVADARYVVGHDALRLGRAGDTRARNFATATASTTDVAAVAVRNPELLSALRSHSEHPEVP